MYCELINILVHLHAKFAFAFKFLRELNHVNGNISPLYSMLAIPALNVEEVAGVELGATVESNDHTGGWKKIR